MLGSMNSPSIVPLGVWVAVAGMIALTLMVVVTYQIKFARIDVAPGLTTQVAALIMYGVGVAIAIDQTVLGVIVSGVVAVYEKTIRLETSSLWK